MVIDDHTRTLPLYHVPWHYNNSLNDDHFNIAGAFGWSNAQTVSLKLFTIAPKLATFPSISAEENEPIITFREKYAIALKRKEVVRKRR